MDTPSTSGRFSTGERPWPRDIFLLLLGVLPLFINLGQTSFWGSEHRWASISKEMLATGDWLEPKLDGEFYGDKPLLSYWAVALTSRLLGRMDEGVARLPSAIAGAVTVLLTGWMAAMLFGRRHAVLAGWVLATAYSFLFWSRCASADLLNLAFTTAAVALYLEATLSFRPWQPMLFFFLLALGGHVKGMPAVILPLGVAAADILLSRRKEFLRHSGRIASGFLLGAALYSLPFFVSYVHRGDWELFRLMLKENFVRAVDAFDHKDSVFYYAYTLPVMFLPWSPWLIGALGWAGKHFKSHQGYRFTLVSFLLVFLAFTASESRRSYYMLPIFPFAALLVAGFCGDMAALHDRSAPLAKPWRVLAIAPLVLLVGSVFLGAIFLLCGAFLPGGLGDLSRALPYARTLAGALLACVILIGLSLKQGNRRRAFSAVAATAIVFSMYVVTGIESLRDREMPERSFAAEVRDQYPGWEAVYFRGTGGRLRYYLGPGQYVGSPEDIKALLDSPPGETLVVCDKDGMAPIKHSPLFESTELLRATSPPFGSVIKARDKYFLFRCKNR